MSNFEMELTRKKQKKIMHLNNESAFWGSFWSNVGVCALLVLALMLAPTFKAGCVYAPQP